MNTQTYQYLHKDVIDALKGNHLLLALQSLQGLAATLKSWSVKEEVDTLTDSYQMMLSYMAKGADDPQRHKMYAGFVRRAYELADVLERVGEISSDTSHYATCLRTLQQLRGAQYQLADLLSPDAPVRDMFDAVWLSGAWTADEEIAAANYMAADSISVEHKALLLSAATLAAMRFFDVAKYRLLLDNALALDTKLRVRALTGLVFVHIVHASRLAMYPEVEARLKLMSDLPSFVSELELLQTQMFLSLETKRIEKSLQNEIIPQMMKRMKDLRIDKSLGIDDIKERLDEADFNPEWNDDGTPSKLGEYMKEFVALQQRGADMYMGSFKVLKQRFPFFNIACNWFWPFTMTHPELPAGLEKNKLVKLMINNAGLCDSDKYSFCLMALQMPLDAGSDKAAKMQESLADIDLPAPMERDAAECYKDELRSYVQGFYRFCNLYIHREAFVNPFQRNLFIADYSPFDNIMNDEELLVRMADFAFKDKSYDLARSLYERVPVGARTNGLLQRLGYCYEQVADFVRARALYEQANVLKPQSDWTLRHLAVCNRNAGDYEKALSCYNDLADMQPEDAALALRQAECLIYLQRYDEAFKYLFKANYLAPQSGNSERALAWCSLLTGKYEQAEKYYTKVLANQPTPTDFLNAGHAAWLGGNLPLAVTRYKRALPHDNALHFLDDDKAMLLKAGLSEADLAMMTDLVAN